MGGAGAAGARHCVPARLSSGGPFRKRLPVGPAAQWHSAPRLTMDRPSTFPPRRGLRSASEPLEVPPQGVGVEAGPSHHPVPQRIPSASTTADTGRVPKRKERLPDVVPSDGSGQGLGLPQPPCWATGRRSASHPRRSTLPRTHAHPPRSASCPSPRSPRDACQAGDASAGSGTRPEQCSLARVRGGVQVGLPTLALLSSDGCASIGCRGVPAGHCRGTACGGVA